MELKEQQQCLSSQDINNTEHFQMTDSLHQTLEQDQLSAIKDRDEIQTFKVSHNLRIHVENLHLFCKTSNDLINKMDLIFEQYKQAVKFRFDILYQPPQNQPSSGNDGHAMNNKYQIDLMDKVEEQCFKELENGVLFVKNFEILKLIHQARKENCVVKPQIDFHSYFSKQILDNYDPVVNLNHLFKQITPDQNLMQIQDSKTSQNLKYFNDVIFLKVNSVHIIHALKRILKSVKIQIDDYEAGIFQFSTVKNSQDGLGGQNIEEIIKIIIQELEIKCEYWLNMWNNKFKEKKQIQLIQNEIPMIWNGFSNQSQKDLQFQLKNYLNGQNIRQENSSIIDIFPELYSDKKLHDYNTSQTNLQNQKRQNNSNILLLCLLQSGNTIDGISISSKILQRHILLILKQQSLSNFIEQENKALTDNHEDQFNDCQKVNQEIDYSQLVFNNDKIKEIQNQQQVLNKFFDWKKRRCHGCLEYMVETSRAVVCFNVIKVDNPCRKLYCFNCTINYCQAKSISKNNKESGPLQSQNSDLIDKQKKLQCKLLRKNQRQKAFQNVLFTCPCCQDECLESSIENQEMSFCKLKNIIERKPNLMIHRHILIQLNPKILNITGVFSRLIQNKQFLLAQVVGYDSPKKLFKINLCYNENNPISRPDRQVDSQMREECSFQTSLLPVNTNYMFLSTILQHNDNFKFNTGKNNEYNDQSSNNKKIVNSRLYKMLNAAINKNEKSDNLSFISNGQIDQDRKFVIVDIKNEIIESIMNLKKQEGKEFVVLERYSEHVSQKGGLDILQQLSQNYEQAGFIERRLFIQNLRKNKINFKPESNNIQINEIQLQQQIQILNQSKELQDIQQQQTLKIENFEQKIEEVQDNETINQVDTLRFQNKNNTQNSQNTQENQNEQNIIENSSSIKQIKNEKFQNGILEISELSNYNNIKLQTDKQQIINKDDLEANTESKRYVVPVVNQRKLENIQKQLEKEFSKIEKLKAKQAIQENQILANPSLSKSLIVNQREKQVILKSEQKIDKLLKQESYLQSFQNNIQNRLSSNTNTLIVNNDQILTYNQELFQPKEVQINSKKQNLTEDPENILLDQNNLVYNSRLKDGKLFIKKFKYNNRLRKHIKFLKEYAAVKPEDFLGLIIYKLNKEQNLWYRSKIISNKQILGEKQKVEFDIKHMNYESDMDRLDSLKDDFILDQAQDPLLKEDPIHNSIANLKRNKKNSTSKSEFNDQQRIHRILMKEWQKNQNKMSLAQAIQFEDPLIIQDNQKNQEDSLQQDREKIDKKRKKALIVIQTRFPFEQRKNPQILHAGQKKWLGRMKQTPRKNKAIKLSNQNTPIFKNSGDEQIYYSDINSEDAYDQQSLNIDNVLSIYQLKIHYCKEIVQHFQFQQNNLSMKLYQQRQMQNKGEVECQSFVNTMDAFLANQKQINYPNISNPITVVSQPHSVYGDSSSVVFNEKNTVLTISAQDNSQKNEKQKKNFSKGAIEERIRQSMGKRKQFQLLLKLFQQKKMNGLNFDESVLQLNQINQKINQQQQMDYQQLQNLPYQNMLFEQQRIQQLKMMLEQQNENGQKQIFNQYGTQNQKFNPFYNKQMVIQIPQYEDQQQVKKIVLKTSNLDQYNEQVLNDQSLKEIKQDIIQKEMKQMNQQDLLMNDQNNYYTEQNHLMDDSQFQTNEYNVQQLLCKQNLLQNGYNQYQQQLGMNEQIHYQSQNDALNPSLQQVGSSQYLENLSQSKQEIDLTKSQTQIEKSFINNHLQTLENIAKSNNIYQKQFGEQIQQQATLPSTWHYEFYEKKGFRKCSCETCKNVPYPALIAAHANENESKLVEDHKKYFQNAEVRHQMLLLQQQDLRAQSMANQGFSCNNSTNFRFSQEANKCHANTLQPFQSQELNVQPQVNFQNQQQYNDNQNWMWQNVQQNQINDADQIEKEETAEQVDPNNQQELENPIQEYQEQKELIEQVNENNSEDRRIQVQKIEEEMNIQKEQFNLGRQIYEKGFAQLKEREEQLNQHFQIYNGLAQNESNEQLDEQARQLQAQMKKELEQQITSSQQEIYIHQLQLNYQYLKLFEVDQAMTLLQNKIDTLNQQNVPETQNEQQQFHQNEFSNQNFESPEQLEQNQEQQQEEQKNNFECHEIVQDLEELVNIYEPQEINEAEEQLQ